MKLNNQILLEHLLSNFKLVNNLLALLVNKVESISQSQCKTHLNTQLLVKCFDPISVIKGRKSNQRVNST